METMKLIRNADVYAPEHVGKRDILLAGGKICLMAPRIDPDALPGWEVLDAEGKLLLPGFVDCHVHVMGGGGEGGFANRTPEGFLSDFTRFGVTTVVGCIGTDGIGRDMKSLIAKVKGLREDGISAYAYTGS